MIRAWMAIFVWGLLLIVPGVPVLLMGLVYPSRRVMAWAGNLWARTMLAICGVRLSVEGLENVADRRPKFFLGNHQSALDIPIILAALRGDVRFMGKNTLFRYPIFGWVLHRYGHVPINRSRPRAALKSLERMLQRVRQRPISLAVFPEGTRSPDGAMLPFRQGTMKICQRSGLPAVPFAIDGSFRVNPRDRVRAYPGPVRLAFGDPIPAAEIAAMSPGQLHDRVRGAVAKMLKESGSPVPAEGSLGRSEGIQSDAQRSADGGPATAHS